MIKCKFCFDEFSCKSKLVRHYRRKTKCVSNGDFDEVIKDLYKDLYKDNECNIEQHDNERIIEQQDNEDDYSILERIQQNVISKTCEEYKCKFCAKEFTQNSDKERHHKICKLRNIPAIKLEIELGIPIGPYKHTTCKFCKKEYGSRSGYVYHINGNCELKYKYEKELIKIRDSKNKSSSQTNIFNNITNNIDNKKIIVLNNFYHTERCLRNEPDKVIDWIHQDEKKNPANLLKWNTPLRIIFETHSTPENNNIRINSLRSKHVEIYDNERWIPIEVDNIMRESLELVAYDIDYIKNTKNGKNLYRTGYMLDDISKMCKLNSEQYVEKNRTEFIQKLRENTKESENSVIPV